MGIKKPSPPPEAASTDTEQITGEQPADVQTAAATDTPAPAKTPRKTSPGIAWDRAKHAAIVAVSRAGTATNLASFISQLAAHPAFADVPAGALTVSKVRQQRLVLNKEAEKHGKVKLADLSGGGGRRWQPIDPSIFD